MKIKVPALRLMLLSLLSLGCFTKSHNSSAPLAEAAGNHNADAANTQPLENRGVLMLAAIAHCQQEFKETMAVSDDIQSASTGGTLTKSIFVIQVGKRRDIGNGTFASQALAKLTITKSVTNFGSVNESSNYKCELEHLADSSNQTSNAINPVIALSDKEAQSKYLESLIEQHLIATGHDPHDYDTNGSEGTPCKKISSNLAECKLEYIPHGDGIMEVRAKLKVRDDKLIEKISAEFVRQ